MNKNKKNNQKGLSGGVKSGPPPLRGPNPQGINAPLKKQSPIS